MISLRKIKKYFEEKIRYFKQRSFRKKVQAQKSKQYLFRATTEKKPSIFQIYTNKKKLNQFANIFVSSLENYKYPFLVVWIFLFLACIYLLTLSPYFRIAPSKVIIERTDDITDINIAYKSIEPIHGQSIFFIDEFEIANLLASMQKNIKSADISRLYPNGLKIILQSYQPQFNTTFTGIDKNYVLTTNGVLIYQKNPLKKAYQIDIIDPQLLESGFFDYKEGIGEIYMQRILFARDTFLDRFTGINISRLIYFKTERELHVALESGTRIILELTDNQDIVRQLAALRFYVDQNKDVLSLWDVQYVDIRNLGRIFVCREKNVCMNNLVRIYGKYYEK